MAGPAQAFVDRLNFLRALDAILLLCTAFPTRNVSAFCLRLNQTHCSPPFCTLHCYYRLVFEKLEFHDQSGGPAADNSGSSKQRVRDLDLMRFALEEAERAAEKGEVPVGAVIARGEEVIASAHNERETTGDPTAHAELLAIRRAAHELGGWRLTGCTLYVTLEPCPMCAGALQAARIGRLVYAAADSKAGAAGTLYDLPADPRLNHTYPCTAGILQNESATLLRDFFRQRRSR